MTLLFCWKVIHSEWERWGESSLACRGQERLLLYKSAWQGKKQAKLFEEDFLIFTSHSISSHLPKLPFLHLNWWKDKETTVSKQSCKVRQKLQGARLRKTSLVQSVCMRQNQQKEAKNVHWQWRTKSFISIIAAIY